MTTQNLLVELFVEELPPKALNKLGNAFAAVLLEQLQAQGLAGADAVLTAFASPRRLAAHITAVAQRAADKPQTLKLMPVTVGLDAAGNATPALLKRLGGMGVDVSDPAAAVARLTRQMDGKAEALFLQSVVPGVDLAAGLQKALNEAIAKLPIPQGHELPAAKRLRTAGLDQRQLRASRARPGGAARCHRGAGGCAGPARRQHHPRPPL
jgi:glycyl-tRNA synthetase beta chain